MIRPEDHGLFLLVTATLPLLIAALLLFRRSRAVAVALAPWSALPALYAAFLPLTGNVAEFPSLLLGLRLGLDATGRVFLILTAVLWLLAGVHARTYLAHDPARTRFFGFYLVTMSGNLGLILAQDIAGFYLFFSLMTFAAYGLIIHVGDPEARRAARVYLIMALLGEALLLPTVILAATAVDANDLRAVPAAIALAGNRSLIIALVLLGFGVKAGMLGLHMWLPLAHPVAPTPASAVLSGCMIKAGLLGWLRFLPLGETAVPDWGIFVIVTGLIAAFYGAVIGVMQDRAKTVLAYSSISQMGLITIGVGIGLHSPDTWTSLALPAVLLLTLHHGLIKGTLFLGTSIPAGKAPLGRFEALTGLGLLFLALALAGAPFTTGAITKTALTATAHMVPADWLAGLLPWTAVGTTLLMTRFLFLSWSHPGPAQGSETKVGIWLPWAALVGGVVVLSVRWHSSAIGLLAAKPLSLYSLWSELWPILLAVAGSWLAWRSDRWSAGLRRLHVPAGDLLELLVRLADTGPFIRLRQLVMLAAHVPARTLRSIRRQVERAEASGVYLERVETSLARWLVIGIMLLVLSAILFIALTMS